jgi:mono/diheme cytochrome c family protein
MLKRVTFLFSASLVVSGILVAQEVKRVEIQGTAATSGQEMFKEYCAVCHGITGQGNGPAASALKKRPADLTQLTRKNGGNFPELRILRYIKGSDEVAAHGSRDMPVWGSVLGSLRPNNPEVAELRIRQVEQYVQSLQAK